MEDIGLIESAWIWRRGVHAGVYKLEEGMAFGVAAKRKKQDHSNRIGVDFHLNMEGAVHWGIGQWNENLGLMEPR